MENTLISADVFQITERIPELRQLEGKRLLITGGTGFVGCWLLETLLCLNTQLKTPCQVIVLTRSPGSFMQRVPHLAHHAAFRFVAADINTFDYTGLTDVQYVIHAAAPANPNQLHNDPLSVVPTITRGTERLLEWTHTQPLEGFLFVSSGAVYGPQPLSLESIPETFNGSSFVESERAAYGNAKRTAETLCTFYQQVHSLPLRIGRLFSFLGPYQDLNAGYAITDFIRDGLSGRPLHISGDGTALRSYAYAADMVTWLWAILLRGQPGSLYNVGSESPVSIRELAEQVVEGLKRCGQVAEIEVAQKPPIGHVPARYIPDINKARAELGLELSINLPEAIDKTLAWFRR